jgi:hypothetical protein
MGCGEAMELTLSAAAQATGRGKSTLLRAVKSGKLSARRTDDGTFMVDASELARVFTMERVERSSGAPWSASDAPGIVTEPAEPPGARVASLEAEVALLREMLSRERATAEAQLSREQETVDDLRKRLDRAEERVLALTVQPAPQPAPEPSAVVEELRRRLEEAEARNQMLSGVVAPQWPKERLSEAPAGVTPPKGTRGFLGRLLGR